MRRVRSATAGLVALAAVGIAVALPVALVPQGSASAALAGLTDFAIDGDTIGPNDWDAPPSSLLDLTIAHDACGTGVLDPDQLDGKLDDLVLDSLVPTPGNVASKADVCQVWSATEAVANGDGSFDVILYGAWERFSASGAATVFWPLLGPEPGNADDLMLQFEDGVVTVMRWDGAGWVAVGSPGPDVLDFAADDDDAPLFVEFALNVSALAPAGFDECAPFSSGAVISQTGNAQSAELQDLAGDAQTTVSACGALAVKKVTSPSLPDPEVSFGYTVGSADGHDVRPGESSIAGDLVVPGDDVDIVAPIIAGSGLTLVEHALPEGWVLDSITCAFLDPATVAPVEVDLTEGGTFVVAPGETTACTIANIGPPTLRVVKTAYPDDGTAFDFEATPEGGDTAGFTLGSGEVQEIPVSAGDRVTITELPADGASLAQVLCLGDDESVIEDASATVQLDAGEQVVCAFVNAVDADPPEAGIVVAKVAEGADGVEFDFAVDQPDARPGTFALSPDPIAGQVVGVDPAEGGTDYEITELPEPGWVLDDARCVGPLGEVDARSGRASVRLEPGQLAVCVFVNSPVRKLSSLTVTKVSDPSGAGPFEFRAPGLRPDRFSLSDGESIVFDDIRAGSYHLSEAASPDWAISGECSDGSTFHRGAVSVDVGFGQDVTCEVLNTQRATVTLTKSTESEAAQDFEFAVGREGDPAGTIVLDDDGDETDDVEAGLYPSSLTAPGIAPGVLTFTEAEVAGWELAEIACEGVRVLASDVEARTVTIDVQSGDSASCEFVNVPAAVAPELPPTGPGRLGAALGAWAAAALVGAGAIALHRRRV